MCLSNHPLTSPHIQNRCQKHNVSEVNKCDFKSLKGQLQRSPSIFESSKASPGWVSKNLISASFGKNTS